MLSGLRFIVSIPLAALLGCSANPSSPSSTTTPVTQAAYNFNGSWRASSTSSYAYELPLAGFSGALQASNGSVTGTLTPYSNGSPPYNFNVCVAVNQALAVTGTLDPSNNLTLTLPIGGGTATILATLDNNPQTLAFGSLQIAGGTCAMSVAIIVISQSAPATTVPVQTSSSSNLNGNWAAGANFAYPTGPIAEPVTGFGGALQFSNGSVTGTMTPIISYLNAFCSVGPGGALYQSPVAVSGTLDAANNLTLTATVAGGAARITAILGANPQTLADGSYQIVGGPCATPATPMSIAQYAPVTGTYTGTFNLPAPITGAPMPGSNIAITAVLTQSTLANASGEYPITGTFAATGACAESATLAPGFVIGGGFSSATATGSTITGPLFSGDTDPSASTVFYSEFDDFSTNANCKGNYQGTLTRQ